MSLTNQNKLEFEDYKQSPRKSIRYHLNSCPKDCEEIHKLLTDNNRESKQTNLTHNTA